MYDPWYILAGVLISAAITWTLRALPFAMLAPLRRSELLAYLGERLPVGIMLVLAVYTMRDLEIANLASGPPAIVALIITIGLQLWRGNMMLSIFVGTAINVVLASSLA